MSDNENSDTPTAEQAEALVGKVEIETQKPNTEEQCDETTCRAVWLR